MNDRDLTRDLRRRLSARFGKRSGAVPMPEHAVLFEVPVDGVERVAWVNQAGETGESIRKVRRRIDAVAVGLWAKTDHLVHGFEIKVSRADLVKELRDPDKSEPARRLCDRWWLVLDDRKLLRDDPIPDGWGVLVKSGRGLRVLQQPAVLTPERDPRFVAALVQSSFAASGRISHGLGAINGFQRGVKAGEKRADLQAERERTEAYWRGYTDGQKSLQVWRGEAS